MNNSPVESITLKDVHTWLGKRPLDAHKGLFGHVLVVGSDKGMPGATRLAAEGALRVGAGLVSVLTRQEHVASIVDGRPELICYGIETIEEHLDTLLKKVTFIVLGPGLGQSSWSKRLFNTLITASQPILLDADGLNWLAHQQHPPRQNWILTPHPGEAARLLNVSTKEIQENREHMAVALQKKYGGIVVLKGANTLISADNTPLYVCHAGNPGMASPGMGDLLSGIIAGLAVQGLTLLQAAQAGVFVHATAGDLIASRQGPRGLLASDLLAELPLIVNELHSSN